MPHVEAPLSLSAAQKINGGWNRFFIIRYFLCGGLEGEWVEDGGSN